MAYRSHEPCPVCGSEATTSDGACQACGHVWGPAHRCAHCGKERGLIADRALGPLCSGCRLPRVVAGWEMPARTAGRIRRAVALRVRARRVAIFALFIAAVCMPLGCIAPAYLGIMGWVFTLLLFMLAIVVAALPRVAARRALVGELAAARREHEEEKRLLGPAQ